MKKDKKSIVKKAVKAVDDSKEEESDTEEKDEKEDTEVEMPSKKYSNLKK